MVIALVRTVILYLFLIFGIRLMGKRQVGELEPTELVLALLIADLAAVPMQDFGIPLLTGLIPIITLLCLTMLFSILTMRSIRFRILMCGTPSIVVKNGVIDQHEMDQNRLTVDELVEELRLQGITDLSTVKYAILETSGQISALLYANQRPAADQQASLPVEESGLPVIFISDGRILSHNLKLCGRDEQWLRSRLRERQCSDFRQVYLFMMDERERVYFARKEAR